VFWWQQWGMDATGNMCSTHVHVEGLENDSTARSNKMSGHPSLRAAEPAVRSERMSRRQAAPTVVAAPASKTMRTAEPVSLPSKMAKVEGGSASTCSGGAGGGMDVNGNQCGE